jgi:hypothetical protein
MYLAMKITTGVNHGILVQHFAGEVGRPMM